MYKEDLAINNQQWLICHKTQHKQIVYIYTDELALNKPRRLMRHKTKPTQIIYI